jgi:hypothetical protein
MPASPINLSLPVRAGLPLEARNDPRIPKSTPPMSMATTTRRRAAAPSRVRPPQEARGEEEISSRSLGQNSLYWPSAKRTSTATYSSPP